MAGAERITVEIAFAAPGKQILRALQVPSQSTVGAVISESGILWECPEIDLAKHRVGIFGRRVDLDTMVAPGDRVEIYRPLEMDPKEARRRRAASAGR